MAPGSEPGPPKTGGAPRSDRQIQKPPGNEPHSPESAPPLSYREDHGSLSDQTSNEAAKGNGPWAKRLHPGGIGTTRCTSASSTSASAGSKPYRGEWGVWCRESAYLAVDRIGRDRVDHGSVDRGGRADLELSA